MSDHAVFLLLGLGNGAAYAALALCLVTTYRSSGVINFAAGAVALHAAYTYAFLRGGELLIPVPGLPGTITVGTELGFWPALAGTLVVSAAFGLLLYLAVFRPLRAAPPVAKMVASIGLMVALQSILAQRVGTRPVRVGPIFPDQVYEFAGVNMPADRLWFAGTIVVVSLALAGLMRSTRFGLATRALAESERGALASGLSPDRIGVANWMIGAALAAVAGVLIAPIVPLAPVSYTLFIVPALAAALVAGFERIVAVVVAGLVIGMLQSDLTYLRSEHSWLPTGTADLVPLVIIIATLMVRGRPLPERGAVIQRGLGRVPHAHRPLASGATAVAVGAGVLVLTHGTLRAAAITSVLMAVIALSLVVVTGFCGQVSLAQLTLAGVGAFSVSWFGTDLGIPFPVAPMLAALGATAVGIVVGLPALRVRGLSLGVVTLALAVALEAVWFRNNSLNGGSGGAIVAGPTVLGVDLSVGSGTAYPRLPFALMCLVLLALVGVGVWALRGSRLGSAMLAVRANERSAAASGVDIVRTKLVAFAIGAFIAGLGGAAMGYLYTAVTFDFFTVPLGLGLFATAYLAGMTSQSGGVLAGLLVAGGLVPFALARSLDMGGWYPAAIGSLLVAVVIGYPEGLVGVAHERLSLRRARGADRAVDSTSSDPGPASDALVPGGSDPVDQVVALSLRGVGVAYGGVAAVDDVTLDVRKGSIVGLIGPNGAGKTTLIDAVGGFVAYSGSVVLGERTLDGRRPHQRARLGLARTFQSMELYSDLTVLENVRVGLAGRRTTTSDAGAELNRVLGLLGLTGARERLVGELSQGRRQLVSIGRALVADPSALLLDEPAGGLDTTESTWLAERLRLIRDSGVTIVLVDHDMDLVLNLCDEVHVLHLGRLIASGPPEIICADRQVAEAYLGSTRVEPIGVR